MVFVRVDDLTDIRTVEPTDLLFEFGEKTLERLLIAANERTVLF